MRARLLFLLQASGALAQQIICSDACDTANDGRCNDGGPGAIEPHSCDAGTDCTDCGNRTEADLPPPPPPSPPAPHPPPSPSPLPPGFVSLLGYLCEEGCPYTHDGECDDGGPGSEFSDCAIGTDCLDCGRRGGAEHSLCTSCPLECNALGASVDPPVYTAWCSEAQWNTGGSNGVCDLNCNKPECNHDGVDCSLDEALAVCRPAMVSRAAQLQSDPTVAGLGQVPIELSINAIDPFVIMLDEDNNQWKMEVEMQVGTRRGHTVHYLLPHRSVHSAHTDAVHCVRVCVCARARVCVCVLYRWAFAGRTYAWLTSGSRVDRSSGR
jgi:hypothetical protein